MATKTKKITATIEYELDADDFTDEDRESQDLIELLLSNYAVYDIGVRIDSVEDGEFYYDE